MTNTVTDVICSAAGAAGATTALAPTDSNTALAAAIGAALTALLRVVLALFERRKQKKD